VDGICHVSVLTAGSSAVGLEVNQDLLKDTDVHIHFPAGAISKDGPSAGVAIATVLVSLFADRCVRSDTAMTGEVTLRGLVLPVTMFPRCYIVAF